MNGNRMKYASTPTYGMQKRGLMKKTSAARPAPQTPDFSKAPDPTAGMNFQQISMPQQAFSSPVPPQNRYMPAAPMPYAEQNAPQQIPFAAPNFIQTGTSPQQSSAAMQQSMPLGNSVPPIQNSASFSARSQGFVPPAPPQNVPNVQPAAQNTPMFSSMPPQPPQSPQQPFGFQPVQAPVNPAEQPAAPSSPRRVRKEEQTLDADKVWTFFLFGFLPLLFIPCLFVSGALGFLRYLFIGAAVVGLGAMWYRQMYNPTNRMIISMVFVALCIGTIAMQMQAAVDVKQTSAPASRSSATSSIQQSDAAIEPEVLPAETPQPSPTPTISGPSQAELQLQLFMELWKVGNVEEMVQLVQPSWRAQQSNAATSLFNMLTNRTPEDFTIEEITGTEQDNSRTVTMRATINKNTGKAPSIYRFMIMMVKEGGEWYVNPNSLATNDQVATAEENVVNNKNEVGDITPAPRTTVTPAPPSSTLLYYNEGGNSYHMDPQCASVKAEYLPFDNSFAYADLKQYLYSPYNLSPCLRCGAPTNVLPSGE